MGEFKVRWMRRWTDDLVAGLTGAVAGAPQAMGFAILAGINPIYGLYSAIAATIVGGLVASSSFMTIAPTNALSLVVGSVLLTTPEATQPAHLFTLTAMIGVMMTLAGVLRLGMLTRFVSSSVMTGFITGAGLLIIIGQLRHLTGITYTETQALPRVWEWVTRLNEAEWRSFIIGLVTIGAIYGVRGTALKNGSVLVALVLATLCVAIFGWDHVALVHDVSHVPDGLPDVSIPQLNYVPDLLISALAMTVLALVQGAAITSSVPEKDGELSDPNRDFIGQGVGNLAAAFFQGMPAAGSLSRTAVNVNAGAQTRYANVCAGLLIGVLVFAFGHVIEAIPLAALAGQLIVAALSLFRLDRIRIVWNVGLSGRLAMIATFAATLFLPLEYSIYVGVALSLSMYIYTSSSNLHVVRLKPIDDHRFEEAPVPQTLPSWKPIVISVSGHLYFAAVRSLEKIMPRPHNTDHPVVILRLRDNPYIGTTGIEFLRRYSNQLEASDGLLLLSGIHESVWAQIVRTGFVDEIGARHIFESNAVLLDSTDSALRYAQNWLNQQKESQ